jgi:hypothetical protein
MSKTTSLQSKITAAVASTKPGKERTEALKAIRWIMECNEGFAALSGLDCVLTTSPAKAQIFDGRDNEVTKLAFWSAQLDRKLTIAFV